MNSYENKPRGNKNQSASGNSAAQSAAGKKAIQLKDNRNSSVLQKKQASALTDSKTHNTYAAVIQRIQDLTDAEWIAQGTVLSAELEGAGGTADLGKYHSGGGGHAEDHLIADLPAQIVAHGLPPGHYNLLFIINRSPCTSTAFNGTVTSNKGAMALGCMEELMALQAGGLVVGGGAYTFQVQAIAKHLYGKNSDERATSSNAVERGQGGGIQIGVGEGFFDTGAAKSKSMVEQ